MDKKISNIIQQISSLLVAGINAKQVYLFGSYATDTADSDSDIDIFVVADLAGRKKIEIAQQARRLLLKKVVFPLDILICDTNDFNIRKKDQTTLEYIVATEGKIIYG
jgi:predicted nucleotidyltransferase